MDYDNLRNSSIVLHVLVFKIIFTMTIIGLTKKNKKRKENQSLILFNHIQYFVDFLVFNYYQNVYYKNVKHKGKKDK